MAEVVYTRPSRRRMLAWFSIFKIIIKRKTAAMLCPQSANDVHARLASREYLEHTFRPRRFLPASNIEFLTLRIFNASLSPGVSHLHTKSRGRGDTKYGSRRQSNPFLTLYDTRNIINVFLCVCSFKCMNRYSFCTNRPTA